MKTSDEIGNFLFGAMLGFIGIHVGILTFLSGYRGSTYILSSQERLVDHSILLVVAAIVLSSLVAIFSYFGFLGFKINQWVFHLLLILLSLVVLVGPPTVYYL